MPLGNVHDSVSFWELYKRSKENEGHKYYVVDAGYKIPAIANQLLKDGKMPVMPYKRPMTKAGFFKKHKFVYDEYFDCYLCPNNQILKYTTTNREGYREYKSNKNICNDCPYRNQCTESKNHTKTVTRHIWESAIEKVEDIRHTTGIKEIYQKHKETIERVFATGQVLLLLPPAVHQLTVQILQRRHFSLISAPHIVSVHVCRTTVQDGLLFRRQVACPYKLLEQRQNKLGLLYQRILVISISRIHIQCI